MSRFPKKKNRAFSRRMFLGAGAGAGAAAVTLPYMLPRFSRAQGDIPKRFVVIYTETGTLDGFEDHLPMAGASEATRTAWELNELMSPLAEYKNDITVFKNLDVVSAAYDPTDPNGGHVPGDCTTLTAAFMADANLSGGISLDQFIANEINKERAVTRVKSINTIAHGWNGGEINPSWLGHSTQTPSLWNPLEVYDKLFPASLMEDDSAKQARLARRDYVHNIIKGEHEALISRLGTEDREKIEMHLSLRSDIEARLGLGGGTGGMIPPRSIADAANGFEWDGYYKHDQASGPEQTSRWNLSCDLHGKMVAAALQADVTRVACMVFEDAPGDYFGFSPGNIAGVNLQNVHEFVHGVNGCCGQEAIATDPGAVSMAKRMHMGFHEKVAAFVKELAETPESDGSRLLDHTVIFVCSQLAHGNHHRTRQPWYVIGGNSVLNQGQYLQFELRDRGFGEQQRWVGPRAEGRPHADLLVALAQAVGVNINTFGEAAYNTGVMSEILL